MSKSRNRKTQYQRNKLNLPGIVVVQPNKSAKNTHRIISDFYNKHRKERHQVAYNGMMPNTFHGTLEFSIETDNSKMVIVYGSSCLVDVYVYYDNKLKAHYDEHYTVMIKNISTSKRLINTLNSL